MAGAKQACFGGGEDEIRVVREGEWRPEGLGNDVG